MSVLSWILWTPIIGVFVILLFQENEQIIRKIALCATGIPLLLSISLFFNFQAHLGYQFLEHATWIEELGVSYFLGIDGLNLSLVLLVTLLTFLVVLTLERQEYRIKAFYCCLLVMETGLLGVFLSLDLILFYIFWEVVLIPGYLFITIWGGDNRELVSIKFLIYTLLGSLLMLIAILAIYFKAGLHTFSILALSSAGLPLGFQKFIFFFLFLGLAIKVPLVPFHSWQPDAYVEAPMPATILFSGLLAKMGAYGFIRVMFTLIPQGSAAFSWLICTLAVITIIYANLCAVAQDDLKRMFAYSSLGHMGLIMLGIGALTSASLEGSIFHMFNHGIIAGTIFMAIGMIHQSLGTIEIKKLRMIFHYIPTGAMLFWFLLLASFGFPGMSSFIGEVYILTGAFQARILFGLVAMAGTIIMAGYIFSLLPRISFGRDKKPEPLPITEIHYDKRLIFSLFSVAVIVLILGFYPKLLMYASHTYVTQFLSRISMP